jgi:hypothetical protein
VNEARPITRKGVGKWALNIGDPLLSRIETGAFARIGTAQCGIVYAPLTMIGKGLAQARQPRHSCLAPPI